MNGRAAMLTPLLRLAAASAAGRAIKEAATDASYRAALTVGAGFAGIAGLFCFSRAALTLLERHMDPAEAWAVVGSFYGVMGGFLYLAASRRRI
jgi:hypothetical protein